MHWSQTIIYEAHVKGMTARHESVPPQFRGSFAGLADPAVIEHLVRLGVTSVELLPAQAFYDDRHLVERGLTNYWGYNTIGFFAPATRYVSPGSAIHEFKFMVRRLHEAGIEVIMDVVYNHTAEGSHMGPTLSFRGIDNASYYVLADDPRYYFDTTGCGNTLNLRHQRVLQMVMDSLRYWVEDCHVDGFRFDLASSLGRDRAAFDPHAVFLEAVRQDPVLSRTKLIAEPWDTGPDGYQVGNFPPGWSEWNDQYRDTVRGFWKGDESMSAPLAGALLGSSGQFEKRGRRPWSSVNFLSAHDGFTLADTVAYSDKHNEANGEENRDGHTHNVSWNWGAEGPTDDPGIVETRDRIRRAMMATLLLSQGTPMILMGDELGNSQNGNNNAYCQDNELSWIDWSAVGERESAFFDFVAKVVAIRKSQPLLAQHRYLHGEPTADGRPNVTWLRPDGEEMTDADWTAGHTRSFALRLIGGTDELIVGFNAHHEDLPFAIPEGGEAWELLLDTADPAMERRSETMLPEGQSVFGRSGADGDCRERDGGRSARHEHRQRWIVQHAGRDAAEDPLAQARMAEGAHHEHVGRAVARVPIQDPLHRHALGGKAIDLDADAVTREPGGGVRARLGAVALLVPDRIDQDQTDEVGGLDDRQGGIGRARSLRAMVPGDDHPLRQQGHAPAFRQHEQGPAGPEDRALGRLAIKRRAAAQPRAQDGDVGIATAPADDVVGAALIGVVALNVEPDATSGELGLQVLDALL